MTYELGEKKRNIKNTKQPYLLIGMETQRSNKRPGVYLFNIQSLSHKNR
jgi:hypothetical protein